MQEIRPAAAFDNGDERLGMADCRLPGFAQSRCTAPQDCPELERADSSRALRQVITGLALLTFCLGAECALALADSAPWLSVDMPHGGCRLTVQRDGEASISFGAMPRWVRVSSRAFDFEQLVEDLKKGAYPQGARGPAGVSVGSLSLPTSRDLLFTDDARLVRFLLRRAWNARVMPSSPKESEDHEWVSRACSLQ